MACYTPLRAWQCADGQVVFHDRVPDIVRRLDLACGQCIGCRLERSRQWAMRCMHEASLYERNAFVTLTYADEFVPADGSLRYEPFQKFMKRLRERYRRRNSTDIRFYMCGEYGSKNFRPHFHACLFNFDFDDKVFFKRTAAGSNIYTSAELDSLWPFGFASVGDVTFESAGYVARYCVQKVTGKASASYYSRVDQDTGEIYQLVPEFNKMSLKPGIGAPWLEKWQADVYPHDYVIVRGVKVRPPKYYDVKFGIGFPDELDEIKFSRESNAKRLAGDNSYDRLAVKKRVQDARLSQLTRSL